MFKSMASEVAQAGVLAIVTTVGAIALRLYSLACRVRRP